jgi:hypothetical protein
VASSQVSTRSYTKASVQCSAAPTTPIAHILTMGSLCCSTDHT